MNKTCLGVCIGGRQDAGKTDSDMVRNECLGRELTMNRRSDGINEQDTQGGVPRMGMWTLLGGIMSRKRERKDRIMQKEHQQCWEEKCGMSAEGIQGTECSKAGLSSRSTVGTQ